MDGLGVLIVLVIVAYLVMKLWDGESRRGDEIQR